MHNFNRKEHWESIYNTKQSDEVSWYEATPVASLDFIRRFNIPVTARIIDIGGGDSFFADHLLELGYRDITVLDISAAAIERTKKRLGQKAEMIQWIVADAAHFQPASRYDFWHDRAAFHFLTKEEDISGYLNAAQKGIAPNGILVIGTFATDGPRKCSGIEVKRYSARSMTNRLKSFFRKITCITTDHHTPFHTLQRFVFCSFRKLSPQ
ncbi:class I SAM-dependent methyltransferase [Niabella beijingensis]|uniref:class I SAM-dependent methyltransferase n=1 Tax=Niabella beijingensis TaxID=2872700 RepID=UPI001CBC019C|nr:class I SAM-dependent methyltransferase [Niabella beijingensis]MBZ4192011.1 class I SAM-dependent methyltransferase [Niabella beijingensis]